MYTYVCACIYVQTTSVEVLPHMWSVYIHTHVISTHAQSHTRVYAECIEALQKMCGPRKQARRDRYIKKMAANPELCPSEDPFQVRKSLGIGGAGGKGKGREVHKIDGKSTWKGWVISALSLP